MGSIPKRVGWKKKLEPFAQAYVKMEESISEGVGLKTDKELKSLIVAAKLPTSSNCWYATYHVAEIVTEEALRALYQRRKAKK
ncbi:hypothetical protein LCGC14_1216690 [marine sediment metagenome]|uniref:Uncharacterized protein n=1 Tax=marine sediment metagenome TaxID=412755 RepID=A0A0F9LGI4_9ZZZZ